MDQSSKVAIFLDVENLSGWLKSGGGKYLLERARELGRVVVLRAYADFSQQSLSIRLPSLNLLGFEFIQVYHQAKGKNSADIQMVVDAMEYCSRVTDLQWFVLATGDSDFSPLFRRLRELGKSVVGVGPRSALSESVKKVCNRFFYTSISNGNLLPMGENEMTMRREAIALLKQVLIHFTEPVELSTLKSALIDSDPSFDHRTLGFHKFLSFLQSASTVVKLIPKNDRWHAVYIDSDNENVDANSSSGLPPLQLPRVSSFKDTLSCSFPVGGDEQCETDFACHSTPHRRGSVGSVSLSSFESVGSAHSFSASSDSSTKVQSGVSTQCLLDAYCGLLKKSSWLLPDPDTLWNSAQLLTQSFPKGFTRHQQLELFAKHFGHLMKRKELRSLGDLMLRANVCRRLTEDDSSGNEKVGETEAEGSLQSFICVLPDSKENLLQLRDVALVRRILNICKEQQVHFCSAAVKPLMYSEDKAAVLTLLKQEFEEVAQTQTEI